MTTKTEFSRKGGIKIETDGDKIYKAIAIGGSAGSLTVLEQLFAYLPDTFQLPVIVVCHLHPQDDGGMVEFFSRRFPFRIREVVDKEPVQRGTIYFPPANYHLLVELERAFALSVDPKVNHSRPSIDVFFESAAVVWNSTLTGIILTGASNDGAEGIRAIKTHGGLTIAQSPETAEFPVMPQAAIDTGNVDKVLGIEAMGLFLQKISMGSCGNVTDCVGDKMEERQ